MSKTLDALRRAETTRQGQPQEGPRAERPFRVVAVTSNKGGVGKSTIATNLAVYLRALSEDLPILVISLDDQPLLDRMFRLESGDAEGPDVADGLRAGNLADAVRLGQYGVHWVPTSRDMSELKRELKSDTHLERVLQRTAWRGLVILDTKSDFEILTRNAIAAADLTLVVVKDQASLLEAERVFDLFGTWGRAWERARIVLSLVDLRIRFRESETADVLALLIGEIRRRGLPLFEGFLSRSPKVESLYTNPEGRAFSILHGARGTPAHRQMHELAAEVMDALVVPGEMGAESALVEDEGGPPDDALGEMKRWLLYGPAPRGAGRAPDAGD